MNGDCIVFDGPITHAGPYSSTVCPFIPAASAILCSTHVVRMSLLERRPLRRSRCLTVICLLFVHSYNIGVLSV
jgi:hypothetical protein